jgi:hypothetical protein
MISFGWFDCSRFAITAHFCPASQLSFRIGAIASQVLVYRNTQLQTTHVQSTVMIQNKNSSDRTTETAGIHRGPLREPGRFVTRHAQSAEHEPHALDGKGARGQRRETRQYFCDSRAVAHRAAPCSRQRRAHWGAQPHQRAYAAPSEGRPSQASQREDGTWEAAEPAQSQRQTGGVPVARYRLGSAGCAGTQQWLTLSGARAFRGQS